MLEVVRVKDRCQHMNITRCVLYNALLLAVTFFFPPAAHKVFGESFECTPSRLDHKLALQLVQPEFISASPASLTRNTSPNASCFLVHL